MTKPEGDALARFGTNMLPLDYTATSHTTPVFNYPYARSRETLNQLRRDATLHPCHGIKLQYVNPASGGYPMPTIGAFLQWLPAGFHGTPYRATDGTVYCVVEGRGRSVVGRVPSKMTSCTSSRLSSTSVSALANRRPAGSVMTTPAGR